MAHGFSATRELRLPAYAERFCAAAIGVLLFDYRHFGASGGEPRELLDISRQHADFHRALAYARDLDDGAARPIMVCPNLVTHSKTPVPHSCPPFRTGLTGPYSPVISQISPGDKSAVKVAQEKDIRTRP
jgi:hypothetical protein